MASAPPAQRSHVGHFRLLEKIGAGGMGEVYRARDEHLQREVAVKLLPAGVLHDPVQRARFRREALALSKLNHPNIAFFLALMRRSDDAVREIQLARSLDPVSPRIRHSVGYIYYYARRYDEAVPHFQAALEMEPTMLSMTYAQQGNTEAAFRERLASLAADTDPRYVASLRAAFAQGGLRAVARLRLQHALELSRKKYVPPTTIAGLYLQSGETDASLDWLEKGYAMRDVQLLDIIADPRFDAIRENPRFRKIADGLGLTSGGNSTRPPASAAAAR